ncbi:MAG: hypothetical protein AAFQ78_00360 [Bacteroidota bacterium]
MRCFFRKFLIRLLGFELIGKEVIRLTAKILQSCQVGLQKKMLALVRKVFIGFLIVGLVYIAFFFSMAALAIYLNEVFSSSYLGFLVVSGGCLSLLSLLIVYQVGRWR